MTWTILIYASSRCQTLPAYTCYCRTNHAQNVFTCVWRWIVMGIQQVFDTIHNIPSYTIFYFSNLSSNFLFCFVFHYSPIIFLADACFQVWWRTTFGLLLWSSSNMFSFRLLSQEWHFNRNYKIILKNSDCAFLKMSSTREEFLTLQPLTVPFSRRAFFVPKLNTCLFLDISGS